LRRLASALLCKYEKEKFQRNKLSHQKGAAKTEIYIQAQKYFLREHLLREASYMIKPKNEKERERERERE
jgi:hypothetical protein